MTMMERIRRRRDLAEAYKQVFSTTQGRKVLEDLCRSAGITSKRKAVLDKDALLFREGQQATVYGILRQVGTDTEQLLTEIEKQYSKLNYD